MMHQETFKISIVWTSALLFAVNFVGLSGCQDTNQSAPTTQKATQVANTTRLSASKSSPISTPILNEAKESNQGVHYRPVSQAECEQARQLFRQLFDLTVASKVGSNHEEKLLHAKEDCQQLGYTLDELNAARQKIWLLQEDEKHRFGRGVFALRVESKSHLLLQAPHAFFDQGTRELVADLFWQGDVRAVAWNNVHRKTFDVAHESNSFMNEFMRAMVKQDSATIVVQLHGFAPEKRSGSNAKRGDCILSNGSKSPERWLRSVTQSMANDFTPRVVLAFPLDTQELGATTNVQAKLLQEWRAGCFLHLELSKSFREQLLADQLCRDTLLKNLEALNRRF
jgi:hypothetical protein